MVVWNGMRFRLRKGVDEAITPITARLNDQM